MVASRRRLTMMASKMISRPVAACVLIAGTLAHAVPVELKDTNGTKYKVNTQVQPLISDSLASGALTNATYVQPTTVTEYYFFITFFGGISTATAKYQIDVPLTPAFAGFNGLLISSLNGVSLGSPLVFNQNQPYTQDCPTSNGTIQEIVFPTETFGPPANL